MKNMIIRRSRLSKFSLNFWCRSIIWKSKGDFTSNLFFYVTLLFSKQRNVVIFFSVILSWITLEFWLVNSIVWSIAGQTHRWRHHKHAIFLFYHIEEKEFMLPWVIYHRRRQYVVWTSVTLSASPRMPLFCSYNILTSWW